jgi:hypothetical protein
VWPISVKTDMQTDIDIDMDIDIDIRVKFVHIRAFKPREISQSTSLSTIHSNNSVASVKRKRSMKLSKGESMSLYRREPGDSWKAMGVRGLEIPVAGK